MASLGHKGLHRRVMQNVNMYLHFSNRLGMRTSNWQRVFPSDYYNGTINQYFYIREKHKSYTNIYVYIPRSIGLFLRIYPAAYYIISNYVSVIYPAVRKKTLYVPTGHLSKAVVTSCAYVIRGIGFSHDDELNLEHFSHKWPFGLKNADLVTVASKWARWRLISPVSWWFRVAGLCNGTGDRWWISWTLWGESTWPWRLCEGNLRDRDRWIPQTEASN